MLNYQRVLISHPWYSWWVMTQTCQNHAWTCLSHGHSLNWNPELKKDIHMIKLYTSIKPIGSRGLTCSRWSLCALWTRPKAHQSGRTDSFQDWHWSKVLLSRGQAAYYHPCLVSHPGILRIVMDSVWCWVCCQKMLFIQNIQRCQPQSAEITEIRKKHGPPTTFRATDAMRFTQRFWRCFSASMIPWTSGSISWLF